MITVTRTFIPSLEGYTEQLHRIWQEGQITNNGNLEKELTKNLKSFLDVENIELVCNGTLALQLAIRALNLKGEILTTPFSYIATSTAIVWEGCAPVFVDIDDKTFCINADLIEAAITEHTCAILATHVYGYPCDVTKIENIAGKYNLKVIYDAAHCFGVRLNGRSLAGYGDISTLSFHATKIFHTAEGGAVICKDHEIAKRIFLLKKFGHIGEDEYLDVGINAKLSELHAAMGLCVLPKVPELISLRKNCSKLYDELLEGLDLQYPVKQEGLEYNYAYYPVIFPNHQSMMKTRDALMKNNIIPRRYFYPSLNTLPYLANDAPCPVSEDIAERVLVLPVSHLLSKDGIVKIADILRKELK